MPVELSGTLSTLRQQVLSTRDSSARTKFGTSGRTDLSVDTLEFKKLGTESNGVMTQVKSGFGSQVPSQAMTAPSHRFGNRYACDREMGKEARPGPGTYEATPSVHVKQPLSPNPNNPSWRIGTGGRFSNYTNVWKSDFMTPAADNPRPTSGWLGDAPRFTFHGNSMRCDMAKGMPGSKPSSMDDPGPGMYEQPSSIGQQHDSRRESSARARIGTADRTRITKSQFISRDHEKDLYGKHSPAPNTYNPTLCMLKTSRMPSPATYRFGSADRFSQVKPRSPERRLPGPNFPGPASYVV